MKRRSFIRSLVLAAAAPLILAPQLPDRFRWKSARPDFDRDFWSQPGKWMNAVDGSGVFFIPRDYKGEWSFVTGIGTEIRFHKIMPSPVLHDLVYNNPDRIYQPEAKSDFPRPWENRALFPLTANLTV